MHWGRGAVGSRGVARQLLGLGAKRGYQPFNDAAPFPHHLQQQQVPDGHGGVGRGRGGGAPAPPGYIGRGGPVPGRQPWESGGPFPGAAGGLQSPGFLHPTQPQAQPQNGSMNRAPAAPAGQWVQQGGLSVEGSNSGGNRSIPGAEGMVRDPGGGNAGAQFYSNGNAAPPNSSRFSDAHGQSGGGGGSWVQSRTDGPQFMGAAAAAASRFQQGSDPSGLTFQHSQGQVLGPSQIQGFGPAHRQVDVTPAQSQGSVPVQSQGLVPNAVFGQGSVSSQGQGQNFVDPQGLGPQQGQIFQPAQGQGFVPAQRQGFVPAQWQGSGAAQGQGFGPAQGQGFGQGSVSSQGQGQNFVPPAQEQGFGQGSVSSQGQGQNFVPPAQGHGFGQGSVSSQGQGQNFVPPGQGHGFGQGSVSSQGQGQNFVPPAQGHGFGQGSVSSQGQGQNFVPPAQGHGFGQGSVSSQGQGQSFVPPAQGHGFGQGSVSSQGQGQSFVPPAQGHGFGQGSVSSQGQGQNFVPPAQGHGFGQGSVSSQGQGQNFVPPAPGHGFGQGSVSSQGQGQNFVPPAQGHGFGQGSLSSQGQGQNFVPPAQGHGFGPAQGQCFVTAQGQGFVPAQGQGFVPQGFVPVQGQGSGLSQGQGVGPSQGQGYGPAQGHGFGPALGQGFVPMQGQGFVPTQGLGFVPAQGQGFVSAQGQGFVPAQGQGFVPTQGQGVVPAQGQGFVPAESQGFVPAQGQVYFSAQGQAFVPVQGQLVPLSSQSQGFIPAQGQGFVSAQGQGFVPAPGQFMPVQGQGFLPGQGQGFVALQAQELSPAQIQGFVQDLGFASAQGQSLPSAQRQSLPSAQRQGFPGAQGPGLTSAQGIVPSQGQNLGSSQLQGSPHFQNNTPFQGLPSFPGPQQQEWQFSNSASMLSQAPGALHQATALSHELRPKMSTGVPAGGTAWPSQDAQPGKDFARLIESNFREGRLHEVEVLFNEMKKMQIAVEVPTYNVLLDTYSQTGQLDKLDQVFKEMRQVVAQRAESIRGSTSSQPLSPPAGGPYQHPSSTQAPPYSVFEGTPSSLSQIPSSRPSPVFTDSVRLPSRVDHTESRPSEWTSQSTWAKPTVESRPAEWSHVPPTKQVSPLPLIKPADSRPSETRDWMPQVSSSRPVSPFPVVKPGESKSRPAVSMSMEPLPGFRPAESTSEKLHHLPPVKPAEPQPQFSQAAITRPASSEVKYDVPASESPPFPFSSKSSPDSAPWDKPGLGRGKVSPASDSLPSEWGPKSPPDSAPLGFKSADDSKPLVGSEPALSSQVPVDKPGFGSGNVLPELGLGDRSGAGRGQALPMPNLGLADRSGAGRAQALPMPDLGLGDRSGAGRGQALPMPELGLGDRSGAGRGQALPMPELGLVDKSGVGRGQAQLELNLGDRSGAGRGQPLLVSKVGIGRGQALPESIPSEQPRGQEVAVGLSGVQAQAPSGLGSDGKPGIGRGRGSSLALDSGDSPKSPFVPLSLFGHGLDVRPALGRGRGKAAGAPYVWQKPPPEEAVESATANLLERTVDRDKAIGDPAEAAERAKAIVARTMEADQHAQWQYSRPPGVSPVTRPPYSVHPVTTEAPPVRQKLAPEEAVERASAILLERAERDRALDEAGRERKRVLTESAKTVILNSDAAVERAMNILQQNLAKQGLGKDVVPKVSSGERSSKGRLNSFLEFGNVAQRKRAASEPSASGEARSVGERSGRRTDPSGRGRQQSDVGKQLTFEEDKKMEIGDAEEATKSALDLKFRRDFDTQLVMEDFGTNPDIEDKAAPTLEEALQEAKHLLMPLDGILDEETWQADVQDVLTRAPMLEKLVEAYSGKGRIAAREQNEQLDMIAGKLPPHASPELTAFTQRALITLQNNPSWKYVQKEQMMKNLVSGFSHY